MGSFSSDVKAKKLTATGALGVGPARIRQIQVLSHADGGSDTYTVVVKDGGSGGDTILDMTVLGAADIHSVNIPADGIRSVADPHFTLGTGIVQVVVFYA